jgi:hypothetical protein
MSQPTDIRTYPILVCIKHMYYGIAIVEVDDRNFLNVGA